MAEPKEKEQANTIGDKLIAEACEAYGIAAKNVVSSRYDATEKTAIILTAGGKRVRFKAGDKVEPLDAIAVTGINPKARKPITGAKK